VTPGGGALAAREAEQVVVARDAAVGYHAVIVLDNTALGPAIGGTRFRRYESTADAEADARRLARGMTLKNSLAGLDAGGGKSVMLMPGGDFDRAALFAAHGRAIERLGGRYITAEDIGTTPADMAVVARQTPHVVGLPDRTGDPGPRTARGVAAAMRAAVRHATGRETAGPAGLRGVRVAIQGCGAVGHALAREVHEAGGSLVVADTDPGRARHTADAFGAEVVPPGLIFDVETDVLAPCALGGILHAATIPRLRAGIVVGGANNQLVEPSDADALAARGILYVPDFLANAGGVITGWGERSGWTDTAIWRRIDGIGLTADHVLDRAVRSGRTPFAAATDLAWDRIRRADRGAEALS
jgi:leucine dehydrogenase